MLLVMPGLAESAKSTLVEDVDIPLPVTQGQCALGTH